MCTISLVPHPDSFNGFILTSNRDEVVSRKTRPPETQMYQKSKMYFPRDAQAGGTWIGVSENERCVCLMNGAEKPHERKSYYRKSRGLVVKDFLAAAKLNPLFEDYDLKDIEAFTMVIVEWQNGLIFYELIWNEFERKITKLPLGEHIWSSSPLYNEKMKSQRQKWFRELKETKGLSAKNLLDFHHSGGEGNPESDLVIDRGFLKTQSISQVKNGSNGTRFWYKDLVTGKVSEKFLQFNA